MPSVAEGRTPQRGHADGDALSDERRFGLKVVTDPDGCWLFNGKPDTYGTFYSSNYGATPAHHYTLRVLKGVRVPDGHHVHHKCFKPGCVNPHHLEVLTASEHLQLHRELER